VKRQEGKRERKSEAVTVSERSQDVIAHSLHNMKADSTVK
jgi:hypothetical protein